MSATLRRWWLYAAVSVIFAVLALSDTTASEGFCGFISGATFIQAIDLWIEGRRPRGD